MRRTRGDLNERSNPSFYEQLRCGLPKQARINRQTIGFPLFVILCIAQVSRWRFFDNWMASFNKVGRRSGFTGPVCCLRF